LLRRWLLQTPGHTYDVRFEDDKLLVASENYFYTVDIEEGKVVNAFKHRAGIYCIRKIADGKYLLGAEDMSVLLLDEEGNVERIDTEYAIFSCAVKDNKAVLGACCGPLYLLDLESKNVLKIYETYGNVYSVDWGKYIYAASFDGNIYALKGLGRLINGKRLAENVNVVSVCGRRVAAGTFEPGGVFVFDEELNPLWSKGNFFDVRVTSWRDSCKGLYVASWDGRVSLYKPDGTEILRGMGPRGIESGDYAKGLLALGAWGRVELYEEEEDDIKEVE